MENEATLWTNARTMQELADLTARWLEGDISHCPRYGSPEPETAANPHLPRINRLGLWTEDSQPGEQGPTFGQRAYVAGYAAPHTALSLVKLGLRTDLVVFATPPGFKTDMGGCVFTGWADGSDLDDNTCVGPIGGVDTWDELVIRSFSAEALSDVAAAWAVSVLDPVWGRDSLLWPAVVEALAD